METAWFPRVVGHAAAKEALRRGILADRLGGALLLCGPAGVGRSLLARELAMALLCQGPRDGAEVPCRACGPCGRVEREAAGDYLVVRPEGKQSIGIEQVQGLLAEMALTPVEGRRRVFVLDPAGWLSEDAQHALLKGLEEPPPGVLLVLVVEHEDELARTILSRCRPLRLGELSAAEVEEVLRAQGLAPEEAARRARWACGSPGLALREDAPALFELADVLLARLGSGAAYLDPVETAELVAGYVEPGKADPQVQRERAALVLGLVQRGLRDALLLREGARQPALSGAGPGELAPLARLARGRLEGALEQVARLEDELSRNANVKLLLDGLALELGAALAPRP